jgi:hypothetical protein
MAVQQITLMFNKKNRELIGGFPANEKPAVPMVGAIFKTLEYDPEIYAWVGTYDNGEITKIEVNQEYPVIDEELLNANVGDNIEAKYPIHKQLNIMMDMLNKSNIENTQEFTDMINFIDDQIKYNKARKEVYKQDDSPYYYVSKENIKTEQNKLLDIED